MIFILLFYFQNMISVKGHKRYKQKVTAKVKEALDNYSEDVKWQLRYVLVVPNLHGHSGHPVGKVR